MKEIKELKSISEYNDIGVVTKTTNTKIAGSSYDNDFREYKFWDSEAKLYKVFTKTKFQKRFTAAGRDIMDVLDKDTDIGKMHRLMRHIDEENMILYSNDNKKRAVPANKELMLRIIGGHEKRAGEFLSKIIKLGIVQEVKFSNGEEPYIRYFVSPVYTLANSGLTLRLYTLFREQLLPYLTEQAVDDLDTLVYYDLHPEKVAELMERDINVTVTEMEKILDDCKEKVEVPDAEQQEQLYSTVASWVAGFPELLFLKVPQDMTDELLSKIQAALVEYEDNRNIDDLRNKTDNSFSLG